MSRSSTRWLVGASKAERLAFRAVFLRPHDARLVPGPAGGAAYTYETAGKPYAMVFRGSSGRPEWHHSYRTVEQRDAHIAQFHASLASSAARKATKAASKAAWVNPLQVGTILYTSWGYDQTNVEFYAVTRVSGRRTWIRRIAADSESTGFMQERCWPAVPVRFVGDETRHTAQPCHPDAGKAENVYLRISESVCAWVEQGRTHHSSSYA